jgi:hypothetical protein
MHSLICVKKKKDKGAQRIGWFLILYCQLKSRSDQIWYEWISLVALFTHKQMLVIDHRDVVIHKYFAQ